MCRLFVGWCRLAVDRGVMHTIRLLGGASVEAPDGPVTGRVAQRRPLALIALLAADPARSLGRDRLMLLLAPESSTERARHLLRDALYAVRAALGADAVLAAGDELRMNRDGRRCDVWSFEAALDAGDPAAAVAHYAGPFLDSFHLPDSDEFDRWADATRSRLEVRYAEAMEALAREAQAGDDAHGAAGWWTRRLVLDPLSQPVTLAAMHALASAGDRPAALRQAATYRRLLEHELGSPPDAEVEELAERLRSSPPPPRLDVETPFAAAVAVETAAPSRRRRVWAVAFLGAAVSVVALALTVLQPRAVLQPDPRRVAVAPFRNATGDPSLDPIGAMAADWVIGGLSQIGLVEVVPLPTMIGLTRWRGRGGDRLSGDSAPVTSLAVGTGAGTVVHGRYFLTGDELVFQVQAVDAGSGVVLLALEPIHAPRTSPVPAIEALRDRLVAGLAPHLDPLMAATATASGKPPSLAAYLAFADGLDAFVTGDFYRARERLESAASADTAYPRPLLYAALARWNLGDAAGGDSVARGLRARADRLAPLEDAMLESLLAWGRADWTAAYAAARRAAALAPGSASAASQVAVEAMRLNRPTEARRVLERLDPDHGELAGWVFYWVDLAAADHLLGHHARELRAAREARRRHPQDGAAFLAEARALAALGRASELGRLLDEALAAPGATPMQGSLLRVAALELRAHAPGTHATALLRLAIDWHAARLQAEPEDASLRHGLARLLVAAGNAAAADTVLRGFGSPAVELDDAGLRGFVEALRGGSAAPAFAWNGLAAANPGSVPARGLWWRAAAAGSAGDCPAAVDLLREAFARGQPFGLTVHIAPELDALRHCPGWDALVRPRG